MFRNFYLHHANYVSFDKPNYRIDGHPAQDAISNFSKTLDEAPALILDREKEKAKIIENLNVTLGQLNGTVSIFEGINIPNLKLEMGHTIKKRRALSTLIIFLPILLAVIIFNTSILFNFFKEFDPSWEEPIPLIQIPFAIIVALIFSVFETSVGFVFGFLERTQSRNSTNSSQGIIFVFGWFVILSLALTEFFLYLWLVELPISDQATWAQRFTDTINSEGILYIIYSGGYFALLGPSVVFVLYILGHQVSRALFDYTHYSDFERFQSDLRGGKTIVDKMRKDADRHFKRIDDLVKALKSENTQLNRQKNESLTILQKFSDQISSNVKQLEEGLEKSVKIEIPAPKLQSQALSQDDAQSMYKTNSLYFIMLIASIFILIGIFPSSLGSYPNSESFFGLFDVFFSIVVTGLGIISGSMNVSTVNVVQANDKGIARLNIEKSSYFLYFLALCIFFSTMVAEYYVLKLSSLDPVFFYLLLGFLCFLVSYLNGRKIFIAIASWLLSLQIAICFVQSLFLIFIALLLRLSYFVTSFINPVLWGVAYPSRYFLVSNHAKDEDVYL